jgi:hypothetical protein
MFRYWLLLFFLCTTSSFAQSGSCGASGMYINYNDYVNYDRTVGGDLDIALVGYLEIGPNGLVDNYGAIINYGVLEVDSGGIFTLYGDMINNGSLIIHKGATVNFYGKLWKNDPLATVTDGAIINTIPGGDVNFIAARPSLPPSWLVVSPCLSIYSGGDSIQSADGANIPMDIALRLKNSNNVVLINTPLRIEGKLQWDVANGNIVLGNQDLIMTQNATQDGFQPNRFAITNGTGHLVKENYAGNWIFPVGITAGDYTPASIDNTVVNTMHVLVQNYATSASVEALTGDGIDRTWNIYADMATGNSNITLQHNSSTNQPSFDDAYNFVTRWSNDVPNTTGDVTIPYTTSAWQSNTPATGTIGNLSSTGTVSGSFMRSRIYTDFATTDTAAKSYFSKSSNPFHPLPVSLVSFSAQAFECAVELRFESGVESSVNKYNLQHSVDGRTFNSIAVFDPKGSNQIYTYRDLKAASGKNLYRIVIVEHSGDYSLSATLERNVDCNSKGNNIILYPNPATDFIALSGISTPAEIRILNLSGRIVGAKTVLSNYEIIDVSQLASSTYIVQVYATSGQMTSLKFVKN